MAPSSQTMKFGTLAILQCANQRVKFLLRAGCHKHLVVGNNDDAAVTEFDESHSVQAYAERQSIVYGSRSATTLSELGEIWAEAPSTFMATAHRRLQLLPRKFRGR